MGTSRQQWHDMDPKIREHRSHCVEYLRQSILCNGDTTIEGETGSWTKSTGWGQTHSCVDFDALLDYANERAIWDLTDQLLPENFDFTKADVEGKPRSKVDESKFEGWMHDGDGASNYQLYKQLKFFTWKHRRYNEHWRCHMILWLLIINFLSSLNIARDLETGITIGISSLSP